MKETLRKGITYGLFPITFVGAIVFTVVGLEKGLNESLLLALVAVITVAITFTFERIHPKHINWNVPRNDIKTDVIHLVVSMLLLPQLLEALLRVALLSIAIWLADFTGIGLWPSHWPLLVQLILAMLISQFGEYWVHRAMHEVPFFWRFHSIHHSSKRLYWLNAARFHPIDTAASFTVALTPLLILGAPNEILALLTVWITVHGLFQHCNVDIKLGPLNYIFSMAELHRWHHSLVLREANSNYGNNIIFWDIVFGTLYYPKGKEASEDIGLHDISHFPENYIQQIKAPFDWERINKP